MAAYQSRAKRWAQACADAKEAAERSVASLAEANEALASLKELQEEYEGWKDNLPENLSNSPLGEKLEEVCGLDLDEKENPQEIIDAIDEAEGLDLPQGFGRD